MDVSPEHLVEQARERFQLQDYYGAIHLLEEVIATGRAFADAHHLLGLSYSLVGQQDQALAQLDRALQLNPQYVEALIHKAIVLNELGREYEADASLRRAGKLSSELRQGLPAHVAAKLANQHAALGDAYLEAGALPQAIEQYQTALALGPTFHDLRYKLGRMLLQGGQALEAREQFEIIVRNRPAYLDAAAMLGLACYLAGDGLAAKAVWEDCRERRPEDPRVEAYLAMLARNDTGSPAAATASAEAPPEPEGQGGQGGQGRGGKKNAIVGLALLVAAGCTRSAADHEELGDRAYAAGAYRDALAEYQLGLKAQPGNADLQAKAAAAALHTGDYVIAVAAYWALAQRDRSRAGEAADGLERVARAALAANDRAAVVSALAALRAVAPERPLGRYARLAALDATGRGDSAAALARGTALPPSPRSRA